MNFAQSSFLLWEAGDTWFLVLIAIVVPVALYFQWKSKKKRQAAIAAWASQRGYQFSPDKDKTLRKAYHHIDLFRQGSPGTHSNIVRGDIGEFPFQLADYYYSTSNGKNTQYHYFTVLLLDLPKTMPSEIKLRPEGMFDKLSAAVGFNDIDFESDAFNRTFHVKAKDRKFAFDVIHTSMMEFLLQHKDTRFELDQNTLCVWVRSGLLKVDEFDALLERATEIIERVPDYVWQEG